jgi:tRNA A37 threonylcarbamoyladenosine modification protein TsaB
MSEAKGLAMALQVPLVGIGTLDVIGYQASEASPEVWAIVAAGRDRVSLAKYGGNRESWMRISDYLTTSLAEASRLVEGPALLAGCGAGLVAELMRRQGRYPNVAPAAWQMRRAAFLAELGRGYLESGGGDQLADLEPLYLRRSAAEERRESTLQE